MPQGIQLVYSYTCALHTIPQGQLLPVAPKSLEAPATEDKKCVVDIFTLPTHYGLDGPGIESRWWRDFPHPSRPALGPTQLPIMGTGFLSRG